MAAPTFQAVGTGAEVLNTDMTVVLPAHQADDILVVAVETSSETVTCSTSGWAEIPDSPQQSGSAGTLTRLTAFWKRATSGAETDPVIQGTTNHKFGVAVNIRGCITTGNPWDVTSGGDSDAGPTSLSITGDTTTVADCLILYIDTWATDIATGRASGEADSTVTSLTERHDAGTAQGNGGGIAIWTGVKATAGAYGPLTATMASSTGDSFMTVAFKPPAGAATEDPYPYVGGGYYPVEG